MTGYQSKKDMAQDKLAQPAQEPVAWPCVIAEADFQQNTITLEMQCSDYQVSAGQHWLHTTPPAAQPVGQAPCVRHCESTAYEIVIRGLKGDIERLEAAQRTWVGSGDVEDSNAYQTPPAQPEQERNFCSRCGKRTADLTVIHTCTPPQENT